MISKFLLLVILTSLSFAESTYYIDKVSQFKILSSQPKNIMMIGDSITDRGLWNELLDRNDIVNRGISGDSSVGLLNRISTHNVGLKKAFIMVGINDLNNAKSVNSVFINYKKILNYYLLNKITPIVQSTLFVNAEANAEINKKVQQLNELLISYCKNKNITFIDLNKVLSPNGYLDSNYTTDRIHLNGDGYKVWANTLKNIWINLKICHQHLIHLLS